ncbi:integrase core domain-containing protein [Paraburkholderia bannensis]|uniref:integrase core domain-containing protein n=1 Tax=Paraburkholderia bannensis TaxID=765414 RepID=UPI0038B8EC05
MGCLHASLPTTAHCWCLPSTPRQLAVLAVWMMRPGVGVSYIRPHLTESNCKDERFHRTLKAEVLQRHVFATHEHVQQEVDRWRHA